MEINRDNYEMFFLLYADNELDRAAKAVEAFVASPCRSAEELNVLLQTRLPADETVAFLHKELFIKPVPLSFINMHNYEEYFVLYAGGS